MDESLGKLFEEIKAEVTYTSPNTGISELSENVTKAFLSVPRQEFVDHADRDKAFENRPLTIGHGQTISQPYIVAIMTELLQLQPHHRVLEIGTGSGYQAAILSLLVEKVFTVERIFAHYENAKARLKKMDYGNIECKHGDGYEGWPEHAPYDAIIVTAAARSTPPALIYQLKPLANLIIPVGGEYSQELLLIHKDLNEQIRSHRVLDVAFVPLTHDPINE